MKFYKGKIGILVISLLCIRFSYGVTYSFDTIATSGFYKLATNVTNQITISVSNVTLDMNGCTVSGGTNGIVINSGLSNVTIKNGTVTGVTSDGIQINSGCNDIILDNITVKNCLRGISGTQFSNAIIRNCDMVLNTTGLQIDTGRNIIVDHCAASANTQAGYSLLTSTTCIFLDCKALATGDGNTNTSGTEANVFGFVTSNGYGNMFQRCIANSTQALNATNVNVVVAGFALRRGEGATSIIGSEASNSTSSPYGITVPYGIWLEPTFDTLTSVTSVNPDDGTGDTVLALDWSPDGKYVAVGGTISGTTNNDLLVYRFDRPSEVLTLVTSANPDLGSTGDTVNTVAWSPDGNYLAVGGAISGTTFNNDLFIYRFDNVNDFLSSVTSVNPGGGSNADTVNAVDWTPDGKYLAVGGTILGTTGNDLYVYQFDRVAETLTQVASVNPDAGGTSDSVFAVNWSPDGIYLAAGGTISGTTNDDLFVYTFNPSTGFLSQIVAVAPAGSTTNPINTVQWSPDGNYLAVGRTLTVSKTSDLFIYRFSRSAQTLTQVDAIQVGGNSGATDSVNSVNWSPAGKYLAVGGTITGGTDEDFFIYLFDRTTETLTSLFSANPDSGSTTDTVNAVSWSPDGGYIAVGGVIAGTTGNDFFIYRAIQFPQNNVITDNTVYGNSGNRNPGGVGIFGSSISNLIINNNSFNNPFNYQFVANAFNQLFGEGQSGLQNATVQPNVPILTPYDLPTRIRRTHFLLESLVDKLL